MSDSTSRAPRRRPHVFSRNPLQQYQSLPELGPSRTGTTSLGPRTLGTDFGRYGAATFSSAGAQPLAAVQSLPEASARTLMPPPPPRPPRRGTNQASARTLMPPSPPRPRRRITNQASAPPGHLMPPVPSDRLLSPPLSLMPVIPSRSSPRSSLPKPSVTLRQGTTTRQMHPGAFGPTLTREETRQPSSGAVIDESPTFEPAKSNIPRNEVATGKAANTETARTDSPPLDNNGCMEILYTRDIEILTEVVENAMYDLACLDESRTLADPRYQGMNASQIRTHIRKTIEDGQYKIKVLEGDLRILGIHFRPVDENRFDPRRFGPGPGGYRPQKPSSADVSYVLASILLSP